MFDIIGDFINQNQITNKNSANIITITFGLISGVLTLVGLLSIFISLNTQQNVQRCREILWNLKGETSDKEIVKNLELYSDIFIDNNNFTQKVINRTALTLVIVCVIIIIENILLMNSLKTHEFHFILLVSLLIVGVFFIFYRMLSNLKSISKAYNLPKLSSLLDTNEDTKGVDTLMLSARTMKLNICVTPIDIQSNNEPNNYVCELFIGFPFVFKNLGILQNGNSYISFNIPSSYGSEKNRNIIVDFTDKGCVFLDNLEPTYNPINQHYWYKIDEVEQRISRSSGINNKITDSYVLHEIKIFPNNHENSMVELQSFIGMGEFVFKNYKDKHTLFEQDSILIETFSVVENHAMSFSNGYNIYLPMLIKQVNIPRHSLNLSQKNNVLLQTFKKIPKICKIYKL
ncbi:hypothetical protein IM538_18600 [Cytobacillus suaedae]|nr:hypothetical protein IM538_18600 [Cytobacillus suaedae]